MAQGLSARCRVAGVALTAALVCAMPWPAGARSGSTEVLDSVPIQGRWSQAGRPIQRRAMEKMLFGTRFATTEIDNARGYRAASFAVGATLWTASTVVTVVQIVQMVDALQSGDYLMPAIDGPLLTLSIGSEVASFFQSRFTSRADYLLYKGIRAYNDDLAKRAGRSVDRIIQEPAAGAGWYSQGGVFFPTGTLLHVLREEKASRGGAVRSLIYRETGMRCVGVGTGLLALAVVGMIEGKRNNAYLGVGIGLTSFSVINGISSYVARRRALRQYNEALRPAPGPAPSPEGAPAVPAATPAGTGQTR